MAGFLSNVYVCAKSRSQVRIHPDSANEFRTCARERIRTYPCE